MLGLVGVERWRGKGKSQMRMFRQPDGVKGSRKEVGRNCLGNSLFFFFSFLEMDGWMDGVGLECLVVMRVWWLNTATLEVRSEQRFPLGFDVKDYGS